MAQTARHSAVTFTTVNDERQLTIDDQQLTINSSSLLLYSKSLNSPTIHSARWRQSGRDVLPLYCHSLSLVQIRTQRASTATHLYLAACNAHLVQKEFRISKDSIPTIFVSLAGVFYVKLTASLSPMPLISPFRDDMSSPTWLNNSKGHIGSVKLWLVTVFGRTSHVW